jgi:dihydropteroate synthase
VNKLGPVPVGGNNPVRVMGILNISPESFYKKSIATTKQKITSAVKKMEDEGADFIDVGGMSTAPYFSTLITEKTESRRISEAIKIIQKISNIPISVDTCRAKVAQDALELGAEIINDISGLKFDSKLVKVVEKFQPSLVLCAFSKNILYGNILDKTKKLLRQSLKIAKSAHISSNQIVLDPAIGFFRNSGKGHFFTKITSDWVQRDLDVLQNLRSIKFGQPLLVSVSNKSFIGTILEKKEPSERLYGSLAAEVIAVLNGADIIRTHNVRETKDAVMFAQKIAQKKSRKAYNTS